MEYLVVVLLCLSPDRCAWHKIPTAYSTFEECVASGKDMKFGEGVYKAGCTDTEHAAELPEFKPEL